MGSAQQSVPFWRARSHLDGHETLSEGTWGGGWGEVGKSRKTPPPQRLVVSALCWLPRSSQLSQAHKVFALQAVLQGWLFET